jgi:hypothetical protein
MPQLNLGSLNISTTKFKKDIKGSIKLPHQDNQHRDHQNYQHFQT